MKGLNILLAAVGGALVGASAALLLAPQKGEDTRKQIKNFIKSHCPMAKDGEVDVLAAELSEKFN